MTGSSLYLSKSSGSADRDGNELQSIRREEDLRQGRISNETDLEHKQIGAFEKYTKVMHLEDDVFRFCILFCLKLNNRVLDVVY